MPSMNEILAPQEPNPSLGQEIANTVSHGIGLAVALVVCPLLILKAEKQGQPWGLFSAVLFAISVVSMYLASSLYHALPQGRNKCVLRTLEHCAILVLIAGTYTPFTLVAIRGWVGISLFVLVWILAVVGICVEFQGPANHRWLPGVLYLCMAWLIVLAIVPLSKSISLGGLVWLLAGGIAYTAGMGFFAARYVPYCHFVWHLFVMAGTACHFIAVWRYVF